MLLRISCVMFFASIHTPPSHLSNGQYVCIPYRSFMPPYDAIFSSKVVCRTGGYHTKAFEWTQNIQTTQATPKNNSKK